MGWTTAWPTHAWRAKEAKRGRSGRPTTTALPAQYTYLVSMWIRSESVAGANLPRRRWEGGGADGLPELAPPLPSFRN